MRKLAVLLLLLCSCGSDDAEPYPKRAGEPCKLGTEPACASEGFMMTCEALTPDTRTEEQRRALNGYLGVWRLDSDRTCR